MWRIEKQRGDLFRLCCAQVNPTIDQRRCILIFVIRQIFLCPQRGAQLVNFNQWLMDCRRFWMPIDEPRIDHPRTLLSLAWNSYHAFKLVSLSRRKVTVVEWRPLKGTRPFSFISFPVIRRVTRWRSYFSTLPHEPSSYTIPRNEALTLIERWRYFMT